MAGHISFTEFFKHQIIPEWKDRCLRDISFVIFKTESSL